VIESSLPSAAVVVDLAVAAAAGTENHQRIPEEHWSRHTEIQGEKRS